MSERKRTAMVTGAGSGLGRAISIDLAANGYCVIAADLHLAAAEETLGKMPARGSSEAIELDVSSIQAVADFAASSERREIDVLINNAGLQYVAPLESFPLDQWQYLINVMLVGSAAMIQAVLPGMRRRNFGRIINIGSIHSHVASAYKSAYVAAKHGLLGLTKVVALETHDVDVTSNIICPAYIQTPLVEAQIAAQAAHHSLPPEEVLVKVFLEPMPKKVLITYEEVSEAVRFLIGANARNITGQAITIDGGWTAR